MNADFTSKSRSLPAGWEIHVEEKITETWVVIRGPKGMGAGFWCEAGEARSEVLRRLAVEQCPGHDPCDHLPRVAEPKKGACVYCGAAP
jgi:hypothetical protein